MNNHIKIISELSQVLGKLEALADVSEKPGYLKPSKIFLENLIDKQKWCIEELQKYFYHEEAKNSKKIELRPAIMPGVDMKSFLEPDPVTGWKIT